MRFYVQATQEHPNEQGVYPLITEGTLQFFTKESYESTPESERLSKDLRPLNSQDTFIEFDIPDSLKTAALKVILEGSDTYAQHPLDPDIITKPCLYTKQTSPQKLRFPKQKQAKANIGIIKAYKKDNLTQTFLPDIDSLSNPHNEIYTIDTDQEIQLRAFVYEEQKDIAEESIKWAFIILEGTYLADTQGRTTSKPPLGKKPILQYPNTTNTPQANAIDSHSLESKDIDSNNPQSQSKLTTIPQGYVELQNLRGDCITLKLSDIFDESLLDSNNPSSLIGKNIVFFAYSNTPAYDIYSDNGNDKNRIITKDRVTSIELKILQTRFSLEFDGAYLSLYENQRKIGEWEARSGNTIQIESGFAYRTQTPLAFIMIWLCTHKILLNPLQRESM